MRFFRSIPSTFYTALNLALVMACVILVFAPSDLVELLTYDRQAILGGQLWRLWTGHLAHFSMQQALLDGGTLLLVMWLAQRAMGARCTTAILLTGMPLISLGLLCFVPELQHYRGASGIAILLAVVLGVQVWRAGQTHQAALRWGLLLLGFCLISKIVLESLGWAPGISKLPPGIRVAWEAHALGAALGALLALICQPRPQDRSP